MSDQRLCGSSGSFALRENFYLWSRFGNNVYVMYKRAVYNILWPLMALTIALFALRAVYRNLDICSNLQFLLYQYIINHSIHSRSIHNFANVSYWPNCQII